MRESKVEAYLSSEVKKAGGLTRKVQWVNHKGAPDRLVLLNGPHFVELKRPKGKVDTHQEREHTRMRKLGVIVHVIDTLEGVDDFIRGVFEK